MESMRKSRIGQVKPDHLLEHFVARTTARIAASLVGVHRNTSAYFFQRLREIIVLELDAESEAMFGGEIEVDESYFGGKRKGKRGRGSAGKIPVFGLLKRGGKVYTKVIPDASGTTLTPIIERKVIPESIVYSDSWKGYNALDIAEFKHCRINHSVLFAEGQNHINGIENFWDRAKRHILRFNGVPRAQFGLYLKECFSTPNPKRQLSHMKQWIKKHMG